MARKKTKRGGTSPKAAAAPLEALTTAQLQAEIRRRQSGVQRLQRRREQLLKKLAEVEAQIAETGPAAGSTRARNSKSLAKTLQEVMKGKTMGVTEAADAVRKAGYVSSSVNFRSMVNQALLNNKGMFKKVDRGQYTTK